MGDEGGSRSSCFPSLPSRSLSPYVSTSSSLKSNSVGETEREREGDADLGLLGGVGGDREVLPLATSFADAERALRSAWIFSCLWSRLVFGETSSVGFALRCGSVVSGIFTVLWQKKMVAVVSKYHNSFNDPPEGQG